MKIDYRNQSLLFKSIILAVLVLVGGLIVAGCNLVRFVPSETPAKSNIIFVTVTPQPSLTLNEGKRIKENAAPEPTARPYFADANELGKVMVLEYHRIAYPEQRYQRTPDNLRYDLQRLYERGYYPVNFIDMVNGLPDVPPGKKPVVLTFDDSDISQFRMLPDNTIDADSAVGILMNFHHQHGDDWPPRATFFVLGNDVQNHRTIFGQSEWSKAKLQFLIDVGMEIGSHTVNHTDLSVATAERIEWELAVSKHVIEDLVPGYTVKTLSVPYGGFPYTLDFLKAGSWEGYEYSYAGNVAAWGGPSVSPFDPTFERYKVSRLEINSTWIDHWLTYFDQNPDEYYISDGDPKRVTAPQLELAADN